MGKRQVVMSEQRPPKKYRVKRSAKGERWNILYGDLVVDYRDTQPEAFSVAFRRATTKRLS